MSAQEPSSRHCPSLSMADASLPQDPESVRLSSPPQPLTTGEMSREDRERLVQQRMEDMRRKNEELLRRHAEIEADKKNADLLSSAAIKDNSLRKPPSADSSSLTQEKAEKKPPKPREPRELRVRAVPPPVERDALAHRMQRLSTEDGPPPDPNYRFLADRMREGDADGDGDASRDRGSSRRHRDNYGGQDFENVRHAMRQDKALQREAGHALPPKLAMTGRQRREYEQWKSDRAAIDQARMQRHMDSEGNFTREWDLHKDEQLGPPSPPTDRRAPRGGCTLESRMRGSSRGRGEGGRRSSHHGPIGGRGRGSPGDSGVSGDESFHGKARHLRRGGSAGKGVINGQDVSHRRGSRHNSQRCHSARSDISEGSTSDDTQGTQEPPPPLSADDAMESGPAESGSSEEPSEQAAPSEANSEGLWEK
nr:coiled-coil domain-containing protein 9-like isoform X1 [Dermacentor andersoni]